MTLSRRCGLEPFAACTLLRGQSARIVAVSEEHSNAPGSGSPPPPRDRATRDVWERTLAKIPSLFGRIVYLASLRNENTGKYQHFGLSQKYSDEEADLVLRESHEELFREWLTFPLDPQKRDLEEYLRGLEDDLRTVVDTWLTLAPHRHIIPVRATTAERELYVSDLDLILELLQGEPSASS